VVDSPNGSMAVRWSFELESVDTKWRPGHMRVSGAGARSLT
jgi:hypothetical protein